MFGAFSHSVYSLTQIEKIERNLSSFFTHIWTFLVSVSKSSRNLQVIFCRRLRNQKISLLDRSLQKISYKIKVCAKNFKKKLENFGRFFKSPHVISYWRKSRTALRAGCKVSRGDFCDVSTDGNTGTQINLINKLASAVN